ncbi:hypothetical protein OIU79_007007 [Salix purpurea]|uniref:Uncharacterized protein n=1 Tax=Salix purpurea TaxID=77065 RepID=A0A9Q0TWY3_SALPP|nr:hypothetical protein OIU79_007007 [Salix purpurea]
MNFPSDLNRHTRIGSRKFKQFLVRWSSYSSQHLCSWPYFQSLLPCCKLLTKYHPLGLFSRNGHQTLLDPSLCGSLYLVILNHRDPPSALIYYLRSSHHSCLVRLARASYVYSRQETTQLF